MSRIGKQCGIEVDGQKFAGFVGESLVDCLKRNNVYLPHICYLPGLDPIQSCDTCWVSGDEGLVRGCSLTVSDGMTIGIDTEEARVARREGIDRVVAKHELYCTVCENNNGNCEVHDAVRDMEVPNQRYPYVPTPYEADESHPFYTYDPDQCILCGRCVEVCQNVEVNETLTIDWEREHPRVLWDGGEHADNSSCVSCGQCVTVCPCNALMEKSMIGEAGPFTAMPQSLKRPMIDYVKAIEPTTGFKPIMTLSLLDEALRQTETRRTKTVCTYCGVGCAFEMWTRGRHILKIQPSHEAPANGVSTCIKGKFGWDFVNSSERLTEPLIRDNGRFRKATWDEALDRVAHRFQQIRAMHGADSLAFVGSSKASNEEAYLTQKLARAVIGTNNVDCCSRYCQNPATKGLFRTVGIGGDAGTIKDLETAELVIIVGSNTTEAHPVIGSRLKRAHKLFGQKHVVADPRRHEMAARADVHLRPINSTDLVWVSALSRYCFDHGYADLDFLDRHVNNVDEFRASLAPFTLEFAERVTGISRDTIAEVGEMIGNAKTVCAMWAMGITQHSHGADTSTAISNLLLVTGNYGRPGTGGYPMRGHNNVQGACDFGSLANYLPGYAPVTDSDARALWSRAWGVDLLPAEVGLNNHSMVAACNDGRLKSMYIIGEEMALVDADAPKVREGFEQLEFMVVQDLFMSTTAQYADVVLPACPNVEKDGTFVNTERRIQRFYKALEPLGDSRPDWAILTDVARRLGHDWGYRHPSEIMAEIARTSTRFFRGVSYERLEGWNSLVWPVAADGSDTPLLYRDGKFGFEDGRARLYPVEWRDAEERVDDQYDLHLNNGRMLEHFHEGNLTGRGGINRELPNMFVQVPPELARERGLVDGSRVRLVSRRGAIELSVLITDQIAGNNLYLPIHTTEGNVNVLTGEHHDDATDTPAFKELAVRMEVLEERHEPPLPKNNYRYGRRTPVTEVGVERKWQRDDYRPPPDDAPNPEVI